MPARYQVVPVSRSHKTQDRFGLSGPKSPTQNSPGPRSREIPRDKKDAEDEDQDADAGQTAVAAVSSGSVPDDWPVYGDGVHAMCKHPDSLGRMAVKWEHVPRCLSL